MTAFRSALAESHALLCKRAPKVPGICEKLLREMPKLRMLNKAEPILTVSKLIEHIDTGVSLLEATCMDIIKFVSSLYVTFFNFFCFWVLERCPSSLERCPL